MTPKISSTTTSKEWGEEGTEGYDTAQLLAVKTSCPLCDVSFTALMVKRAAVRVTDQGTDFRATYEGIDPLYYAIWVCPNCNYAAYRSDFHSVKDREKKALMKILKEVQGRQGSSDFSGTRDLTTAYRSFELALLCYGVRRVSLEKIGGLYLRLAWMARDGKDYEKEKENLTQALNHLIKAFETDPPKDSKSDIMLHYMIGELSLQLGLASDATQWFVMLTRHDQIKKYPALEKMARIRWEDARSSHSNQKQ